MKHRPNFYIIAADTVDMSHESERINARARLKADLDAANLPYKVVRGAWRGKEEPAFLIVEDGTTPDLQSVVLNLRKRFRQDAVLYCYPAASVGVYFADTIGSSGKPVRIGLFRRVASTAGLEGWTLDPATGEVWAA